MSSRLGMWLAASIAPRTSLFSGVSLMVTLPASGVAAAAGCLRLAGIPATDSSAASLSLLTCCSCCCPTDTPAATMHAILQFLAFNYAPVTGAIPIKKTLADLLTFTAYVWHQSNTCKSRKRHNDG